MWYITLCYIVIFKLPVSANVYQFQSVADMTNIHRPNVMQANGRGRVQGQVFQNYQPTTCINIPGRYEGGVFKNQETFCNTVHGRSDIRRPGMATTRLLLYSRVSTSQPPRHPMRPIAGVIKPQMMLPKQLGQVLLTNQKSYIVPRQVMMRPLIRASLSSQRPTHSALRELVYHGNERNRDYQEYHLFSQPTHSDDGNRDHQGSPSENRDLTGYPQHTHPDNRNTDRADYPALPPAAHSDNEHQDYHIFPQPVVSNDGNIDQLAASVDVNEDQQEQGLYPKAHGSTSTAAPVHNQAIQTTNANGKSTTSTMPPFPGGYVPGGGGGSRERPPVCAGKAKCNQFIWTTKKKVNYKQTMAEFTLWTP